MSLKEYHRKRKFGRTPEPEGKEKGGGKGPLKFVVQLHRASRLHYDFRLEFGGTLKSWAVPKGPSINPMDQRLAVFVEDHPLEYGSFEGIIPAGNYGAGTVMVWDSGTVVERSSKERKDSETAMAKGLAKGHITFVLDGEKLKGEFALIKLKNSADKAWLLVKKRDAYSTNKEDITKQNLSVKTGRTLDQIAAQAEAAGDIWLSKRKNQKNEKFSPRSKPENKAAARIPSLILTQRPTKSGQAPFLRRVKAMVPVAAKTLPSGNWFFEEIVNGVRAIAEWDGRTLHLYSRSLLPFEKKYPTLVAELKKLPKPMVLDGEIVEKKGKQTYLVSDILFCDGHDLRQEPLEKRKELLANAFEDSTFIKKVKFSKNHPKDGKILAKKADSPYHSGVSKDWLILDSAETESKSAEIKKGGTEQARLTHLDKVFWPEEGYTKGDLIEYYKSVSQYLLPHLKDKPESLNRHPNGITKPGFYQKDVTGYIPRWFKTQRIFSESTGKSIDYAVCQDERSLLYIANLGCIEINPWFSRIDSMDHPDYLVIDLDPDDGNTWAQVVEVAKDIHKLLDQIGAENHVKTSGATGIHIAVPTCRKYDFDTVRKFSEEVCKIIQQKHPATTSMDRTPAKRRRKIYLDCLQNRRGQTLAAPYSVRPRPGAPVSTPLEWKDLKINLRPEDFHMFNTLERLKKFGDLWEPVLKSSVNLEKCLKKLR